MEQEKPKKKFYKKWWFWTIAVVVVLIIIGAGGSKKSNNNVSNNTNQPSQENTQQQTATTTTQKSYQEVFKFSGNGAKKSEPFTIQGDRFKISYDCKGDPSATLCTAFVFKVGSSLPQAVMNSVQSTKDETVIYTSLAGTGEYYIDANVLGSFTMTVYDYK